MKNLLIGNFLFYFSLLSLVGCGGGSPSPAATLSNNANLSALSVSTGALNTAFNENITAYSLNPTTNSTLNVTSTLADSKASFTINGNTGLSGNASGDISLSLGSNTISIEVTAEDTTVTKTYTISVERLAVVNSNASLSNLVVSVGSFTPGFTTDTLNYSLNVSNGVATTTLTATSVEVSATINIKGNTETSGVESAIINLDVGANSIDVVVTAIDGSTTKTYSVIIIRAGLTGSNADLSNLSLSETTLDQIFNANVTGYTASTEFLTTSVKITPTSSDTKAVITINNQTADSGALSQPIPLSEGNNDINIKVTSADGITTKTYTLTVARELASRFAQKAYIKSYSASSLAFGSGTFIGIGIAISGNTLAVTAALDELPDPRTTINAVYIFVRNSGIWTLEQRITDELSGLEFAGTSLDLDGDTLVVGAHGSQVETSGGRIVSGSVKVFTRASNVWSLEQKLQPNSLESGMRFGWSVSVSGNTIAVGAPLQRQTIGAFTSIAGGVTIFTRSGTSWSQQVVLTPDNLDFADSFGTSLNLYNDTLVVSSPSERSVTTGINGNGSDNSQKNSGAVYVFKGAGASWAQQAYIKSDVTPMTEFGSGIALYENMLTISSPRESKVYVYTNSSGTWLKHSNLQPNLIPFPGSFGGSIALYKKTLVVGSTEDNTGTSGINSDQTEASPLASGAAYVFSYNGSNWQQDAFIKAGDPSRSDRFGATVAIFDDILAVVSTNERSNATGINGDPVSLGLNTGAVYVFD